MKLGRIAGFRLVTPDAGRLIPFYRALGFGMGGSEPIARDEMGLLGLAGGGMRTRLSLGDQWIDLDEYHRPGRPYPTDAGSADAVFQHFALVTDDADSMWRVARGAGAAAISRDGPITLPPGSGGVRAVKFRDPDGHPLEFLQFPDPAAHPWRGTGVQGIDHSAIVASDEPASRRFYEEYGLTALDGTCNQGAEQEALDDLQDVRVRVRPMRPAEGATKLELLGYRHPPVTRVSEPTAVNDVAATRTVWQAEETALLSDPDGHRHQLGR